MILFLLLKISLAQSVIDAFVKIIDNSLAGAQGTYEFTVNYQQGQIMLITLPQSLKYSGKNQANVDVCQLIQDGKATDLANCAYITSQNQISFQLPIGFQPGYMIFDIGPIQNPGFSTLVNGFQIQILDDQNTAIYQADPNALFVSISPNTLTNPKLTVDSLVVAALTTYSFSVTTTNQVSAGGFIQIDFPTTQIQVPQQAPTATMTVQGQTLTLIPTQTSSLGLTYRVDSGLPALTPVNIKLNPVNNPNTITETNSFTLKTLTNTAQIVDQIQTGLTVKASVPAQITIDQLSPSNRRVGASTSITFKVTLPITYSSGGSLTIQMPSTVQFDNSKLQCLLFIGFSQNSGQCNMPNPTQINIFASINQVSLTFSISGFINPPNTKPTESFTATAYDPQGNVIMQTMSAVTNGYTPTPGQIQSSQIIRKQVQVGQATETLISFNIQNVVQSGQMAVVTIPNNQFLVLNPQLMCEIKTQYDAQFGPTTCSLNQQASSFTLQFQINCNASPVGYCTQGVKIELQITGLKNLNWIVPSPQSASITTMTADLLYQIDSVSSGLIAQPQLQPGSLANLKMVKPTGQVSQQTQIQIQTTTANSIPEQGYLRITFPDNGLIQSEIQCLNGLQCQAENRPSGYVNTITVANPCGTSCQVGQTVDVTITNLKNGKSVYPVPNQFNIATFTAQGYAIDSGMITDATDLKISPSDIATQLLLPQGSIITGELDTYSFSITTTNGISHRHRLVLTFPQEIQLTSQTKCAAYQPTTLVMLDCVVQQQTLVITHNLQQLTLMTMTVQAQNIKNPPSTKPSSPIIFQTYLQVNSQYYLVDQNVNGNTVTCNVANQLTQVKVTRSVAVVNTVTNLEVCIIPRNPSQQNSLIFITIPTDQATIQSNVQSSLQMLINSNQKLSLVIPQAMTSEFCFTISNLLNPSTTKPALRSIELSTQTNDGFQIDQMTSGVMAQPQLSAGPFQSVSMQSSNQIVGQITTLTILIGVQIPLEVGQTLQVTLPQSTYYQSNQQLLCMSQPCKSTATAEDSIGTYFTQIIYTIDKSYSQGQLLTLTISNLLNQFSTQPRTGQVVVQSVDSSGYTINSSAFTQKLVLNVNPNAKITLELGVVTVQQQTTLQLDISLATRLKSGSTLTVEVPNSVVRNPFNVQVLVDDTWAVHQLKLTQYAYQISVILTKQYLDLSQIKLKISGFQNLYSVQQVSGNVKVTTQSNDYGVDESPLTPYQATLKPTKLSVSNPTLANNLVGQQTDLSFELTLEGTANIGSTIKIELVKQVFYAVQTISIQIGTQIVEVQHKSDSQGFLTEILFTTPVQISNQQQLAVRNLLNLRRAQPLELHFNAQITDQNFIAQGTSNLGQQDLLKPALMQQVSIQRTQQALSVATDLQISLTVGFPIIPQSTLQIRIPNTEFQATGSCSSSCVSSVQDNFTVLTISNVCSSGCQAGQLVQLLIKNAVMNPSQVLVNNQQSQIILTNGQYQSATGSCMITPGLVIPGMSNLQINQDNFLVGSQTNVTFTFNLVLSVPSVHTVIINFPPQTYVSEQTTCRFISETVNMTVFCVVTNEVFIQQGTPNLAQSISVQQLNGLLGVRNSIQIQGLRNIDYVRPRSAVNTYTVSLVAQNNQIVVQGNANESQLQNLTAAVIKNWSLTRKSDQIGQNQVKHVLQVLMPTYLRLYGYLVITIPQLQSNANRISCQDQQSLNTLQCQLRTQSNGDQIIKIQNWCSTGLCRPGQIVLTTLTMDNPTQIDPGNEKVTLQMFTQSNQPVAMSTGIDILPFLKGVIVQNVKITRLLNVIGSQETLNVYIPSMNQSLITTTNVVLTLPQGLAWNQTLQQCNRTLRGKVNPVDCQVNQTYPDGSVRTILVHGLVNQQFICLPQDDIAISISGIVNPNTNKALISYVANLKLITPTGQDVGFAKFDAILPAMTPGQLQLIATVNDCKTFQVCPLTVNVVASNFLMKSSYVLVTSPLIFNAYQCQVGTNFTCQVVTRNTVNITCVQDNQTSMTFTVPQVQMPQSNQKSANFTAQSFETLINGTIMVLDEGIGGSLTIPPSQFKQFQITRSSSYITDSTDLTFDFVTYVGQDRNQLTVKIPNSSGLLTSKSRCSRLNKTTPCQLVDQTLLIENVGSVCKQVQHMTCQFTITNVQNPQYFIAQNEKGFEAALTSGRFMTQQHTQPATPRITPMSLSIEQASIIPDISYTAQSDIVLKLQIKLPTRNGQFLKLEFDQSKYVPQLSVFKQINVQINNQTATVVSVDVGGQQGAEFSLLSVTTTLPHAEQLIDLEIQGLNNPDSTNFNSLVNCNLTVQSGISAVRFVAAGSKVMQVSLLPSKINPIDAYLVNPFIGQQTHIQIAFNTRAQINQGTVRFTLPSDFQIGKKPKCSDLSLNDVRCVVGGQKFTIQFSRQPAPYSSFAFQIGPVINPKIKMNLTANVEVFYGDDIVARDEFTLQTFVQGSNCSNCQTCNDQNQCVVCQLDLILHEGVCQQTCPSGTYENFGRCFSCPQNCSQCQRQDSCTVCNNFTVSGMCSTQCPIGFLPKQNQCVIGEEFDGSPWVKMNSTAVEKFANVTSYDRRFTNQTSNVTELIQFGKCEVKGCAQCGLLQHFCQRCQENLILVNGQCLGDCPPGMFKALGQCYNCNSACKTCQFNANQCQTCNVGSLFVNGYQMCVRNGCPGGTYQFNDTVCGQCDSECNTCNDLTQCTSCFTNFETNTDMYYYQGRCLQTCPAFSTSNLERHNCESEPNSYLVALIIPILAAVTTIAVILYSKVKSGGSHEPYGVAASILLQFYTVNEILLVISMWSTNNIAQFCVAAVTVMACSALGVYTRWGIEIQQSKLESVVSQISGPISLRLGFSKYCGIKKDSLDPHNQIQLETVCLAQTILVLGQAIAGLVLCVMSGPQEPYFGLGLNSAALGLTITALQIKLYKQALQSLQTYKQVLND